MSGPHAKQIAEDMQRRRRLASLPRNRSTPQSGGTNPPEAAIRTIAQASAARLRSLSAPLAVGSRPRLSTVLHTIETHWTHESVWLDSQHGTGQFPQTRS